MSLMTHLWQSTLCAGVVALLAFALRRASARTRHTIWLVASVKFLVPLPLFFAAGTYVGAWLAWLALLPDPQWSAAFRWLEQPLVRWTVTSGGGITSGASLAPWGLPLGAIWLAGVIALALRQWKQWRAISSLARTATPLESGREAEALRRLASGSPLSRVPLLRCATRLEPGVLGVFRPKILWPSALSDRLQDPELEAVLSHELCHIERRDNLSALVQMLVETLFWFHPIVWWIGARMVAERERACDEAVVERGAAQQTYAEGILKVCRFCLRSPVASVASVGRGSLSERIERIMRHRCAPPISLPFRLLLAGIAVTAVSMPLAAGVVSGQQKDAEKPQRKGPGVTMPVLVTEAKPNYTPQAMKAKIQGSVWLEAVVLADGTVGDVKVTKSLDSKYGLDDEAVKSMKKWRFKPGLKDKKPVPVVIEAEMSFKLK